LESADHEEYPISEFMAADGLKREELQESNAEEEFIAGA
jgi:hypothetical protein